MTKRATLRTGAWLAVLVVLGAACSEGEEVRSGDGPTPGGGGDSTGFFEVEEPAAEEAPDDSGTDATMSTTTTTSTTTTEPIAVDPRTSPRLASSGEVTIPHGDPGELAVVMTGPPDGGSLPVVVRNRTNQPVFSLEVTGTARDADGSLAGSGRSQGLSPSQVDPGEWAFGYVYFGFDDLPDGATFDLTATGRTDPGFMGSVDVLAVELNQVEGSFSRQIVGIVENDTEERVSGPISVGAACFDPSGTELWSTHRSFTDGDELPAGATTSFSIDLFNGDDCPTYVVGASGWSR